MAKRSTLESVKFKLLMRDLKMPAYSVIGLLEMLWCTAHASSHIFNSLDEIEVATGWDGEIGVLAELLIKHRFVDDRDGNYELHDYFDHAPKYVIDRENKRQKRTTRTIVYENTPNSAPETPFVADTTLLVADTTQKSASETLKKAPRRSLPYLTLPNLTLEEKPISSATEPVTKPLITFPCIGTPKEWGLSKEQFVQWRRDYDGLDVRAEIKKAHAWIMANQRKTAKGMPRFLVNWFNTAVSRGLNKGTAPPAKTRAQLDAERDAREQAKFAAELEAAKRAGTVVPINLSALASGIGS